MTNLEITAVKVQNTLNKIVPKTLKNPRFAGIITAAGSGTRMGGISKQLMDLNGNTCLSYSLKAFQNTKEISEIIVVGKKEELDIIKKLAEDCHITKLTHVVAGGDSRQASIYNGFSRVSKKCDYVAIHDAARPLITSKQISMLLQSAEKFGAACAAKKMSDTVKRSVKNDMISETVPRDDLFTVQTPQVFNCDIYRVSLAVAERDGICVTDDCSLVEHAGFPIKLIEIGGANFKLTTLEDVEVITSILKERSNV